MNTNQFYAHCFIADKDDILSGYFLSPVTPTNESITAFCYDQQNNEVFAVAKCKVVPYKSKEAEAALKNALNIYILDKLDKADPNEKIGPFCKATVKSFKNTLGYDNPTAKSLVIVESFEMGVVKKLWKFPNPAKGKHYFVNVTKKTNDVLASF